MHVQPEPWRHFRLKGRKKKKSAKDRFVPIPAEMQNIEYAAGKSDIVHAVSINPEASIDDEFWLGPSRIQVHADLPNLDEEEFLAHPVGKRFRIELSVRVVDEEVVTAISALVGRMN